MNRQLKFDKWAGKTLEFDLASHHVFVLFIYLIICLFIYLLMYLFNMYLIFIKW